jgi:hypothetical protein
MMKRWGFGHSGDVVNETIFNPREVDVKSGNPNRLSSVFNGISFLIAREMSRRSIRVVGFPLAILRIR